VGLAPGVRVSSFPVDLSELWYAARAVRRQASPAEALAQVARRGRPGPWLVALRREGGRLSVWPLSRTLAAALEAAAGQMAVEEFLSGGQGFGPDAAREAIRQGLARAWY
jgi:hypothetical protein